MTVTINVERLNPDLLAELKPLIQANHEATKSGLPLNPDWELFDHLDSGDALVLVVVRHKGKAVGYCAQTCYYHQSCGDRWATCVAIYLAPAYRRHFQALITEMERLAKDAGAKRITYGLPPSANKNAFFRFGYCVSEVTVCKELVLGIEARR